MRRRRKTLNAHPWRNDCPTGKLTYRNELEVAVAKAAHPKARPYVCWHCGHWHLTTHPPEAT